MSDTTKTEEPILPDTIGPYAILRKLGAGGMGTVYLGKHVDSGLVAAVKVLSASLAREPGVADRFQREIDAMRKLTGPHIVELYESGHDEENDQMFFAMEYIKGETLGDLIKQEKRLTWDKSIDITLQICSALKSAHMTGIIHRDLKPSNLLLGNDGLVKLTDFGVAQVFAAQRLTVTGGVIGTAEYMSPEQAQGKRCTKTSDLYSLGAVLYVMLTGRPPFTGRTSLDIIHKHLTGRFDKPSLYAPDMPRPLEDIVCQLLSKDPEDRYGDAHIVSLRLKEVVKRVELANRDETIARPMESGALMAPTAAAPVRNTHNDGEEETFVDSPASEQTATGQAGSQQSTPRRAGGPGPATIMRDAMQAELARQQEKSPVGAFFDNTWVLVGSLVLLIAGGVLWMEHFGPRADNDDDTTALDSEDNSASGEIDRFIRMAKSLRRSGDTAGELRLLTALRSILAGVRKQEEALHEIDLRIAVLENLRVNQSNEFSLARETLRRAEAVLADGQTTRARELLHSLLVLYGNDPGASEVSKAARELLDELTESPPDSNSSE